MDRDEYEQNLRDEMINAFMAQDTIEILGYARSTFTEFLREYYGEDLEEHYKYTVGKSPPVWIK